MLTYMEENLLQMFKGSLICSEGNGIQNRNRWREVWWTDLSRIYKVEPK